MASSDLKWEGTSFAHISKQLVSSQRVTRHVHMKVAAASGCHNER